MPSKVVKKQTVAQSKLQRVSSTRNMVHGLISTHYLSPNGGNANVADGLFFVAVAIQSAGEVLAAAVKAAAREHGKVVGAAVVTAAQIRNQKGLGKSNGRV